MRGHEGVSKSFLGFYRFSWIWQDNWNFDETSFYDFISDERALLKSRGWILKYSGKWWTPKATLKELREFVDEYIFRTNRWDEYSRAWKTPKGRENVWIPTSIVQEKYMTLTSVARMYGISRQRAHQIAQDRGHAFKLGIDFVNGRWRVRMTALPAWTMRSKEISKNKLKV